LTTTETAPSQLMSSLVHVISKFVHIIYNQIVNLASGVAFVSGLTGEGRAQAAGAATILQTSGLSGKMPAGKSEHRPDH